MKNEYNADWHAKRNGFESESERWQLSNQIDNSIPDNIEKYQKWHFGDGTKEGLLKLVKELKK